MSSNTPSRLLNELFWLNTMRLKSLVTLTSYPPSCTYQSNAQLLRIQPRTNKEHKSSPSPSSRHPINPVTSIISTIIVRTIRNRNLRQLLNRLPLQTRTQETRKLPPTMPIRDARVRKPICGPLIVLARQVYDGREVGFWTSLFRAGSEETTCHTAVYLAHT